MCHHSQCCSGDGLSRGVDGLSRRAFLAAAGTTFAGSALAGGWMLRAANASEQEAAPPEKPADWPEIVVAYVRPKAKYWLGWPGTSWEDTYYPEYLKKTRAQLEQWGRELQVKVTFLPEPLYDDAAVDACAARLKEQKPQGVVVFPLHMNIWGHVQKIADAGAPTIIYAPLGVCFTGHIQKISKQPGVFLISSPDFELTRLRYGLKMVRTAHDIRRVRIAVLHGDQRRDEVLEPLGVRLRHLPRNLFSETLQKIEDTAEVRALADEYAKAAQQVVEPNNQDLLNAARNFYASQQILKDEDCQGITMDCLGAVYDKHIPCPPCLAWAHFLDMGIPAICEADINAVMSHTLCCKLLDKPGFMQDPVPETVHNTFIGAHCVCATRLNGYDQPREPFRLRSHSESNVGVSVQVLWRPEQPVTIMQMTGPASMILGRGQVLRNFDTPPAGGCRTSVELAIDGPPDTRDTKGFHQLFIYGDHVRDFEAFGQMYGIATEHI
ncbi:MAG: hypothetical protein AB1716_03640 [Planctomycetota bacterium]